MKNQTRKPAPIEVEILVGWGSAHKIVTKSGTTVDEISKISAL